MITVGPKAKELLADVEASGKSRHEISLKTLCDQKPTTYGLAGSDLRRDFQKTWDRMNTDIVCYYDLLKSNGVTPSSHTEAEYVAHKLKQLGLNRNGENGGDQDNSDDSKPPAANKVPDTIPGMMTPPRTPARPGFSTPPAAASTPNGSENMSMFSAEDVENLSRLGSEGNPFKVFVERSKVSMTLDGTAIAWDSSVDLSGYNRGCFFFCRLVGPDIKDYSFTIPSEAYPMYKDRCVLMVAPSTPEIFREKDRLESAIKKLSDNEMPKVLRDGLIAGFTRLQNFLRKKKSQQKIHILYILPEGTELDNYIVSYNAETVTGRPLKFMEQHPYFGGKAQRNVIGVWAVAERPDELNSSSKIHATYDVTGNW